MPRLKKTRFSPAPKPKRATLTPLTKENAPPPVPGPSPSSTSQKMRCVVCYNEFTYYPLTCSPWESAVTKDFYVALNIPEDELGVAALPFCPECHSKVAVMFSLHQQLQNILQNFNCVRNDLA